jgi:hypothetical protein
LHLYHYSLSPGFYYHWLVFISLQPQSGVLLALSDDHWFVFISLQPQSGVLLALSDGTVTFKENEGNKLVNIGIVGTGFLEVGTTFSVSLVEVQFLGPGGKLESHC